jgi:hypothetical protein
LDVGFRELVQKPTLGTWSPGASAKAICKQNSV